MSAGAAERARDPAAPTGWAHPADHRFYGAMSIACATVILIGFASKYVPHLQAGGVPAVIHVHAAIFTAWLALFITQATLIRRDRIDLHRRLGTAGVALAAVMLVVGVQVSLVVTRAGDRGIPGVEFPEPGGFLLLNLMAVGEFAVLVIAGWLCRNNPQAHKRLMLLATISLTPPGIGRLPLVAPHVPAVTAVAFAFFLAGPVYDLVTKRRIHRAYLGALVFAVGAPPVVAGLAGTGVWHRLAAWLL